MEPKTLTPGGWLGVAGIILMVSAWFSVPVFSGHANLGWYGNFLPYLGLVGLALLAAGVLIRITQSRSRRS